MATKVKPSRINITGTPQVGQVPVYVDESCFEWGDKQEVLTAGPNITLSGATISGDFNYAEPTTSATATTKCVCIPEITQLCVGQRIVVKPTITATNCATDLKLNSFCAYPVRYNNAALTSSTDGYVWGANQLTEFLFDGSYWHVVAKSYDTNTTYTLNYDVDAGKYKAGSGNYAISRYVLVMEKDNGTWEKLTDTSANYNTGTSKGVNTNGFKLGHIRYYSTTTVVANGALAATNTMSNKAASVDLRYSTNCGGVTNWGEGDYIYIVGTMGNDGLFYLDTTTRWSNKLPSTNDGKLYIRIGICLAAGGYTCSLLENRPIYYYDNGIKVFMQADNKQDTLVSGTNIKTINGCSLLGSGDICIGGGGGGTGDMEKCVYDPNNCSSDAFNYCNFYNTPTIPTDNCELANGCGYTTCTGTLSSCADIISALGYTPYNSTNPCGYTTCTGTLVAGDIACLAQCCDIPTDNCQLANGCGYTTCTGTLSGGDLKTVNGNCLVGSGDICIQAGVTSVNGCTGAVCLTIPTDNCELGNSCGYTTCTGTLQSCDIACVNGCCLTNGGNICISGGADYSWVTKAISGGCLEIGLRTIVNPPTSDFTLTVPATIQEGEEYVIRTISCASYCMCLGSCITNPRNVCTTLSANATDQYVFLAICGELELQPLVATGS